MHHGNRTIPHRLGGVGIVVARGEALYRRVGTGVITLHNSFPSVFVYGRLAGLFPLHSIAGMGWSRTWDATGLVKAD